MDNTPDKKVPARVTPHLDDDTAALFALARDRALAFRNAVGSLDQRPAKSYAQLRTLFAGELPKKGAHGATIIEELARLAEQGLATMTGPRFFSWVIGASHPVGVAADWLTAAWGQNAGNHAAAPSATACEEVVARWMLELLDLPREASVGIVTGATIANFVCLAAARDHVLRRVGWDVEEDGLFGAPSIRVFLGADAHTSVLSALRYLGLGAARVIRVPTDGMGRMLADQLSALLAAGDGPAIVITQAGQINTGGFDPWPEIVPAAKANGAWVHVDGAFGLWARACPARKALALGCELADSWATDGHKWLQLPYDCGFAIVRHEDAHRRAMATTASYLPKPSADERNPVDYVPELSRRARGFAAWALIRTLGSDGIAEMIDRHCRLAARMAERLAAEPGIFILNEVVLNQAVARFGDRDPSPEGDALTKQVIDRVVESGVCYVGGATWRDRWVMRLSIISWPTQEWDIGCSANAIIAAWREVRTLVA